MSIEDLLPGLMEHPLWEGTDDEFAAYVRKTFGIPVTLDRVTITPRAASGRSAVAIGGKEGAIIFVLSQPAYRKTQIDPIVAGPLIQNADVAASAVASDGIENMSAVTQVALRHLPDDVVRDLIAPIRH